LSATSNPNRSPSPSSHRIIPASISLTAKSVSGDVTWNFRVEFLGSEVDVIRAQVLGKNAVGSPAAHSSDLRSGRGHTTP
jgi:hypothetical protein